MENENLTEKISKYIALRITSEETGRSKIKLTEMATLLSAIAALIGAGLSLYTSYSSLQIQKEINDRQVLLDERDYIGNLYYQRYELGYPNASCGNIPSADKNKWAKYHQCLFDLPMPEAGNLSFKGASQQKRFECLESKLKLCRKESPNIENAKN